MPVEVAVPLAVLVSITIAVLILLQDWRRVHLRSAGRLVFFTLLGVPLGLLLLRTVPESAVKAVLGAIIIAFAAYSLTGRHRRELKRRPFFGFNAGLRRRPWNEWSTAT